MRVYCLRNSLEAHDCSISITPDKVKSGWIVITHIELRRSTIIRMKYEKCSCMTNVTGSVIVEDVIFHSIQFECKYVLKMK